ncbi:hypothetical protein WMY93_024963 [Mugilogobius chulae]|uniref:Uncharacterized protein n=1 Tax=Mugilogobius chulae TaxID=88201 RepID=A0AAW0N239_9GOBI
MQFVSVTHFKKAMLLVLWVFLMIMSSAAERLHLSCLCKGLPGHLTLYQLSPELPKNCTEKGWEDAHKTAITRGSEPDKSLVHSLTDQTLVMRECRSYLHFTAQCGVFVEANCTCDCSPDSGPPPTSAPVMKPSHKTRNAHDRVLQFFLSVSLLGIIVFVVYLRTTLRSWICWICSVDKQDELPEAEVPFTGVTAT